MSAAKKQLIMIEDLKTHLLPGLTGHVELVDGHRVRSSVASSRAIVAVKNLGSEQVLGLAIEGQARQICQVDAGSIAQELNVSALMLKDPEKFFSFPVNAILSPGDISEARNLELTRLAIPFQKASDKSDSLEKLRLLLVSSQCSETLIADALLVADEIFTNAVYNAPFVDSKTGFNPGIDRNNWSVEMGDGQFGELMVGHDDERLVIACRDPFGSLNVVKFFSRIRECFDKGVSATMRMGNGGAGIGSFMVFNVASSLYVGVKKGKCTVVGVSIHWKWSGRRRSESPKNLHYIEF